jgi:hypothetical protein
MKLNVSWRTALAVIAGFLALAVALPVLGWSSEWLAVAVILLAICLL